MWWKFNGSFTSIGAKAMVAAKDYSVVEIIFSFLAAFKDRTTGYLNESVLTAIITVYLDLAKYLMFKPSGVINPRVSSFN